jgi:hypothetical protein
MRPDLSMARGSPLASVVPIIAVETVYIAWMIYVRWLISSVNEAL